MQKDKGIYHIWDVLPGSLRYLGISSLRTRDISPEDLTRLVTGIVGLFGYYSIQIEELRFSRTDDLLVGPVHDHVANASINARVTRGMLR